MNPLYFQAKFLTSANALRQLPDDAEVEVAFAGRSNAGKSSALNRLTRNSKLARTSKTPGRTQLINYFQLGEATGQYLVDLPGYGYAKVSRDKRAHWQRVLGDYLIKRQALKCLVLLTDVRHPLTDVDWQLLDFVLQHREGAPLDLHLLLTKADKLSRNKAHAALHASVRALESAGVEASLQLFSALKGDGLDDLHGLLDHYFVGPSDDSSVD
ncbi:MAG: ribosome biogenesis GTP-binding protein YihA/YsxC [Pseudomonadota bacterium]